MLLAVGCTGPVPGDRKPHVPKITLVREVGKVPLPAAHGGRDVGFSAVLQDRSVWIFGDTFLPEVAGDGLRWRSSSWSWTTYPTANGKCSDFEHAVDSDGMALQLLPHTIAESSFNIAHSDQDGCAARSNCGSRRTPWPQAIVTDASQERAVIFYANMETGPDGQWDFRSVSGSVALWDDPAAPAVRVEPPLFSDDEPDWGSAAVRVDDDIFVYACGFDGESKPCLVARVPFGLATERGQYRFWAGDQEWSRDWRDAVPIFDGGSLFSVHYSQYLQKYVAFYIPGIDDVFMMRTADQPKGPWSEPTVIGKGERPGENWNYALIAHPEYSRENGRIELLSYTQPSGFLRQNIRLVEIRFD